MKAILISIKPKYVVDILNGKKTIEIRKSMPKCDLPIDVYIYCTKSNYFGYISNRYIGKVVAKFTLNKVEEILTDETDLYGSGVKDIRYFTLEKGEYYLCEKSCLEYRELKDYLGNNKGYAWHISNLEIFGKPKELREFVQTKRRNWEEPNVIKAPQSFMFIEVE